MDINELSEKFNALFPGRRYRYFSDDLASIFGDDEETRKKVKDLILHPAMVGFSLALLHPKTARIGVIGWGALIGLRLLKGIFNSLETDNY